MRQDISGMGQQAEENCDCGEKGNTGGEPDDCAMMAPISVCRHFCAAKQGQMSSGIAELRRKVSEDIGFVFQNSQNVQL